MTQVRTQFGLLVGRLQQLLQLRQPLGFLPRVLVRRQQLDELLIGQNPQVLLIDRRESDRRQKRHHDPDA